MAAPPPAAPPPHSHRLTDIEVGLTDLVRAAWPVLALLVVVTVSSVKLLFDVSFIKKNMATKQDIRNHSLAIRLLHEDDPKINLDTVRELLRVLAAQPEVGQIREAEDSIEIVLQEESAPVRSVFQHGVVTSAQLPTLVIRDADLPALIATYTCVSGSIDFHVSEGQRLEAGDIIATHNRSGAEEASVRFALKLGDVPLRPVVYLPAQP